MMMKLPIIVLLSLSASLSNAIPLHERQLGVLESIFSSAFGVTFATSEDSTASTSATVAPSVISNDAISTSASIDTAVPPSFATGDSSLSSSTSNTIRFTVLPAATTSFPPSVSSSTLDLVSTSATSSSKPSTITTASSSNPTTNSIQPALGTPPEDDDQDNGISKAGIAVAAIMSAAIIATLAFIVLKWCAPFKQWRAARNEKQRNKHTYQPALDGPLPENLTNEKGLGLSYPEARTRPFSFLAATPPLMVRSTYTIKRKPLPNPPASNDGPETDFEVGQIGIAIPMGMSNSERRWPSQNEEQRCHGL